MNRYETFEMPPLGAAFQAARTGEASEMVGASPEQELGRRGGAFRPARPPVRARAIPPPRPRAPAQPKRRPPRWPPRRPIFGTYPFPIVVEPFGSVVDAASIAERRRCMQACLAGSPPPVAAPPAPPEPGAAAADAPPESSAPPPDGNAGAGPAQANANEPAASELEWLGETPSAQRAPTSPKGAGTGASCASYARNEVEKSRTSAGHLSADVIEHARGLLIADFGVDWRTPRPTLKRDPVLQAWIATIVDVIRANPGTTIRVLGFSDCVGTERNNQLLRRGRAVRVLELLKQMAGAARWTVIKPKVKLVNAAPADDYVARNDTIDGRAQNRSVLIEHTRTIDFKPTVLRSCMVTPRQVATYPLLGLIPNLPGKPAVPIDYKLDAKQVIGEVARDVSQRGKSAHFWVELAHAGLVAAEIFAEGSLIVAGLAIAGPLLGLVGTFLALGSGYQEAAEEIAKEWSATGYSRGVVMGAEGRKARELKDYFGNLYFPPNHFFPKGRDVAIANYRVGLLVGYVHGRLLCPNQRALFWRDLGKRMGDQSYRGDSKSWTRRGWIDWYMTAAATFKGAHLR